MGSLKGYVRVILNELLLLERRDYDKFVKVLLNCFGIINCVEMFRVCL